MRRALICLCVLACIVLLDTLAWAVATAQLRVGAKHWIAQTGAHGWTLSHGAFKRGGWPLTARLDIQSPAISGGGKLMPGGLAWSSGRLVLSLSALNPATLHIAAEGTQYLRLSHAPQLVFTASRAVAGVQLWGSNAAHVDIVAEGLDGGLAGSRHPQDVQLASLRLQLDAKAAGSMPNAVPSARLRVQAAGIALPDNGHWALGATIAELAGTLSLTSPPVPHAPGTPATPSPEDQARTWRDGGGQLSAQDMHVRWGPAELSAAAKLGLDSRLQPAGAGTADVTGSHAALQALAGAGVLPPGLATTAEAVLAFMPSAPGHPDAVRLPFVLHDNTIGIGQIPVFHLNDIAWR